MNNKILEIAISVRKQIIEIYDSPQAVCLEASRKLKEELNKNGLKAEIIMGRFMLDEPDYLEDEEIFDPLHYWVEIEDKILDITADQFKDEVIDEDLEEITYGDYENYTRYIKDAIYKRA